MGDILPKDKADHHVIGNYFKSHGKDFGSCRSEVYYCDSYDPRQGYWMTSLSDETNRKNVSEMAIGRTFHQVHDHGFGNGMLHCQWGKLEDAEVELVRGHVESTGMTPSSMRM